LARLRVPSGRQVIAILERHGFVRVRGRGSHVVMQRRTGASTITVPVPDHKVIRRGTLSAIIRQSRVPREAFE
jgi:predicted RNA binding protein YcfA (HicA-like mRNA interferase family)